MTTLSTTDEAPRWQPDVMLVPAILAGSTTRWRDLSMADKAWVAIDFKRRGYSAEYTAERMECAVRTVRAVLADALGQVMELYQIEVETFGIETRMAASEVARLDKARAEAERDRDRYKDQLDRLLDRFLTGESGPSFPKCGHPKTKYNTYKAPKTGKLSCRMCHADAQREYEKRRVERMAIAPPG